MVSLNISFKTYEPQKVDETKETSLILVLLAYEVNLKIVIFWDE